jgi:hypothetical protein
MGGFGAVLVDEIAHAHQAGREGNSVILVEGASDRAAIETLARRRGRDLEAEGVAVIAMAGATNASTFLDLLGPAGYDVQLVGLCDEREERTIRYAAEQAGLGSLDGADLEQLRLFVCVRDLEDELIRALGMDAMLGIITSQGQLGRFRSFQNQPAQIRKTIEDQIWRWLGNHKIRYAPLMVEALAPDRVPAPIEGVLAEVRAR